MNKKQTIQQTALDLFVTKGYLNTPVRDIIDGSGHGTSTFYRHFRNKEDVLRSLLQDFLNELLVAIGDYYKTEENFQKRFVETKKIVIDMFVKNKGLAELYVKSAGLGEEIENCIKEFDDMFIESSIKNISFGIKDGLFRDVPPAPVAYGILGIIKYLIYKWVVLRDITDGELFSMISSFHESLGVGVFKEFQGDGEK